MTGSKPADPTWLAGTIYAQPNATVSFAQSDFVLCVADTPGN
jgi:hypothetical protein